MTIENGKNTNINNLYFPSEKTPSNYLHNFHFNISISICKIKFSLHFPLEKNFCLYFNKYSSYKLFTQKVIIIGKLRCFLFIL